MNKEKIAYLGLSLMTLITGLSFIFVKLGLAHSNPYDLLAHRFTIAFFTIAILKIFSIIKIPKISKKDWIAIISVSIFYPLLFFAFQALGLEFSTASEAGIIFAFLPIFTLLAGKIFLKEKTTFFQKVGALISFSGLFYIYYFKSNIGNQNIIAIIFLVLSVLTMVGYFILGKKIMRTYNSLNLTAIMVTIAFIAFNLISIYQHLENNNINSYFEPFLHFSFTYSVLYLGILSTVLTSFLSNYSLIYLPASKISIFSNLNPIIAIIGGILLLGEAFFWYDMVGTFFVLLGVILVLIFKPQNNY